MPITKGTDATVDTVSVDTKPIILADTKVEVSMEVQADKIIEVTTTTVEKDKAKEKDRLTRLITNCDDRTARAATEKAAFQKQLDELK